MNIVYMNGGLGNQMFQYIFFRWLEINSGEKCVIDNAPFYLDNVPHNGYELNKIFGLKPAMLSDMFDEDIWQYMLNLRENGSWGVAQQLLNAGRPIVVIREHHDTPNLKFNGQIIVDDELTLKINGKDLYYHGYWMGDKFFNNIDKVIRREFKFPKIKDKINRKYASLIEKSKIPVAIHIRRGDMAQLGRCCSPDYFYKVIEYLEKIGQIDKYFLFSDDLKWCADNAESLGLSLIRDKLINISGNSGDTAYRDMQLMSMCRHRISDRSSFSLMAGCLCPYDNKQEINNWR
ncbi:MAG: alpha-1,2-fucosyltransferase [Selenomonadaceae bacterium]|nr:alpha-1,2-fucosyltransferase [Selenomonadaceae bacterium]